MTIEQGYTANQTNHLGTVCCTLFNLVSRLPMRDTSDLSPGYLSPLGANFLAQRILPSTHA